MGVATCHTSTTRLVPVICQRRGISHNSAAGWGIELLRVVDGEGVANNGGGRRIVIGVAGYHHSRNCKQKRLWIKIRPAASLTVVIIKVSILILKVQI